MNTAFYTSSRRHGSACLLTVLSQRLPGGGQELDYLLLCIQPPDGGVDVKQLHDTLEMCPVIYTSPTYLILYTTEKLLDLFDDKVKSRKLKIELAVTVDTM